jgi:alanine dehydrogenase
MPGAVPRTSTLALVSATLPYVHVLANLGWRKALDADLGLKAGLNISEGKLVYEAVGHALNIKVG